MELDVRYKRDDETKTFSLVLEDMLDGDTISAVSAVTPSDLTVTTPIFKNSATLTLRGVTYAISSCAQITLSGGTIGQLSVIEVTVTTTNGDEHHISMPIMVVEDYAQV